MTLLLHTSVHTSSTIYIVLKTSRNSQMTLCNSHQVTRIWWWENDTDTHCAVHPKLYIPSTIKTKMHIVPICFWVDWAVSAVLKISVILLKYPTFFSNFHGQNKIQNWTFCAMHWRVHTKKLINIEEGRKRSILAFKLLWVKIG